MKSSSLTIMDGEGCELGDGSVLYWRGWDEGKGISIPRYIEVHSDRLRKKYLAFIHQLGGSSFAGRPIVDYLDAGDGFSYWWMSLLSEKNPFKSARLYDCIRLLALEEILAKQKYTKITLISGDLATKRSIEKLCSNLKIDYFEVDCHQTSQKTFLRSCFDRLPIFIQGLIAFGRHVLFRWELRNLLKPKWFSGTDTVFICSYFFNLNENSCESGEFQARQWGELPQLLKRMNIKSNWIHQLVLNSGAPPRKRGLKWMSQFNKNSNELGRHAYLDTFLSWPVLIRAFKDWIYLVASSWRLKGVYAMFVPEKSAVDLWPFLKEDWKSSISGPVAVNNCLWRALFDVALRDMPHQCLGFYLWENQGWEMAFLHAWRRYGHGKIIGVPHATTVFWHLNNFDDIRIINSSDKLAKPFPDFLAINGPMAERSFVRAGIRSEKLLKVEALRYQYLNKLDSKNVGNNYKKIEVDEISAGSYKLLVLGDASFSQTVKMMDCVKAASLVKGVNFHITLKPHPASKFSFKDCADLDFDILEMPLESVVKDFEGTFVGNSTSAAIEVLLLGLTVVIFLEDDDFNHSPMRGDNSVFFAGSGLQLLNALRSDRFVTPPYKKENFFWLDDKMPRWCDILLSKDFR